MLIGIADIPDTGKQEHRLEVYRKENIMET